MSCIGHHFFKFGYFHKWNISEGFCERKKILLVAKPVKSVRHILPMSPVRFAYRLFWEEPMHQPVELPPEVLGVLIVTEATCTDMVLIQNRVQCRPLDQAP